MAISRFLLSAAAAMVLLFNSHSARANLVINGSFEDGPDPGVFTTLNSGSTAITGWTVTNGSIDYIGTYWQPADGARSIDLDGNSPGTIAQQTLATLSGQTYLVSFALAGNPDGLPTIKTVDVTIG